MTRSVAESVKSGAACAPLRLQDLVVESQHPLSIAILILEMAVEHVIQIKDQLMDQFAKIRQEGKKQGGLIPEPTPGFLIKRNLQHHLKMLHLLMKALLTMALLMKERDEP